MYPQTAMTPAGYAVQGKVDQLYAESKLVGHAQPRDQSEVERQMSDLISAIGGAEGMLASLRDRLSPVLRTRGMLGQKDTPPPPEEVLCMHGDGIRSCAKRVSSIARDLDDLLLSLAL